MISYIVYDRVTFHTCIFVYFTYSIIQLIFTYISIKNYISITFLMNDKYFLAIVSNSVSEINLLSNVIIMLVLRYICNWAIEKIV